MKIKQTAVLRCDDELYIVVSCILIDNICNNFIVTSKAKNVQNYLSNRDYF